MGITRPKTNSYDLMATQIGFLVQFAMPIKIGTTHIIIVWYNKPGSQQVFLL